MDWTPAHEQVCIMRVEAARLDERQKAADKALALARAHWLSTASVILSIAAILVALFRHP